MKINSHLKYIGKNLGYWGKYIDQPLILSKINTAVPPILITGATGYALHDAYHNHKDASKKNLIKNVSTLAFTVAGSLAGLRGLKMFGKQIIPRFIHVAPKNVVKANNKKLIENFINKNENLAPEIKEKLRGAIERPFKRKDIIKFEEEFLKGQPRVKKDAHSHAHGHHHDKKEPETLRELFDELVPPPGDTDLGHAFDHVKRLTWLGALPVIGGITGGIIGDRIVDKKNWKQGIPNKIKEGSFQWLANITLCNVGAFGALFTLDRLQKTGTIKPPGPIAKAGAMVVGIMATGVIGGSFIANFIGQKIINPLLGDKRQHRLKKMHFKTAQEQPNKMQRIYHERVPEALDIALHVDDIATVGVLSGLKWIEPALPLLYAISGYRAGMGYRNHHVKNHFHRGKHHHHNREIYFKHMKNNPAFISFNSNTKTQLTNKGQQNG